MFMVSHLNATRCFQVVKTIRFFTNMKKENLTRLYDLQTVEANPELLDLKPALIPFAANK